MIKLAFAVIGVLALGFVWCLCIAAGRADDEEARDWAALQAQLEDGKRGHAGDEA